MMKQKKMQKQLLLRKDTCLPKKLLKENKLLKNEGQYLKSMYKLRYISPEERQPIIDKLRLV